MENPSNIIPDQLILLEGDAGLVPKASSGDVGKVLGVLNSSGDVGWVPDQEGMAQVQADWDQTDSSQVSYIANKPNLSVYATTSAMNTALAGKQDTISDLSDIRAGATAGATAVQPSALNDYATTSAMNTALAGKQDVINDLSDIRAGAAKGDTAVQPAALESYATTSAMNTALAGKQNVISDLDTIRAGAAAGATAAQPSDLPSSDELLPSASSGDSGKVLTVNSSGNAVWSDPAGSDVTTANGNFKLGGSVPVTVNYTGSQEYERGSLQLVNTFDGGNNYAVAVFEVVGAHYIDYERYDSATVTINEAMDIAGAGINDFAITFLQSDSNWYNDGQIYKNPSPTVTDGKIVAQSLSFYSISQYATGPYLGVGVKVTNSPYESEKVTAVLQQLANGAVSISNWPKEQITVTTIPNIPASTSADANKVLTVDAQGAAVWQNVPTPSMDEVPAVTSSDDGKVLKASYSGGQGSYAWGSDRDTTYTAGNMIAINANNSNAIGVSTTAGITDIQQVAALPANPVATVLYLIPST